MTTTTHTDRGRRHGRDRAARSGLRPGARVPAPAGHVDSGGRRAGEFKDRHLRTPKVIRLTPDNIGSANKSTVYVRRRDPAVDTEPLDRWGAFISDQLALRARRLPGGLLRRLALVRVPVPRRRLRLPRHPRGRPAAAPAGPLPHARTSRPGRDRPSLQRQPPPRALLAARSRRAAGRDRPDPLSHTSLRRRSSRRAELARPRHEVLLCVVDRLEGEVPPALHELEAEVMDAMGQVERADSARGDAGLQRAGRQAAGLHRPT